MELKRLLMQFINLNFIERKNNRKGKTRGIQLHHMQHARGVESHPHMLEIHALPKMLYAVCARKGHSAKVCKSNVVEAVEQQGEDSDSSEVFLGAVSAPREVDLKKWFTITEVCVTQIKFKMDTGADDTCIPESVS